MEYYKCQNSIIYHNNSCFYLNQYSHQISYDDIIKQQLSPCIMCKPFIYLEISVRKIIAKLKLKRYTIQEQEFKKYLNYKLVKITNDIRLYDNQNDIVMDNSILSYRLIELINLFLEHF